MHVLGLFGYFLCLNAAAFASRSPPSGGPLCVDRKADIYILADSSGSVSSTNWQKQLQFIVDLIKTFPLGPRALQVGFGIFGTNLEHQFDVDKHTDQDNISQAVLSTQHLKGYTYTYRALRKINAEGYLNESVHGSRYGVPKILVVITDGQSISTTKTLDAAADLREAGITIFSVGIGVTNQTELRGIAGYDTKVFNVNKFSDLASILDTVAGRACQVTQCLHDGYADVIFVSELDMKTGDSPAAQIPYFLPRIQRQFFKIGNSTELGNIFLGSHHLTVYNLRTVKRILTHGHLFGGSERASTNFWSKLLTAVKVFNRNLERRPNVTRIIVVIDDGTYTRRSNSTGISQELKDQGIIIITVGIKPYANQTELSAVASKPKNYIEVDERDNLLDYVNPVVNLICDVSSRRHEGHLD